MNQAFSKIWIVVILAIFIAGGILAWQHWRMPKEVGILTLTRGFPASTAENPKFVGIYPTIPLSGTSQANATVNIYTSISPFTEDKLAESVMDEDGDGLWSHIITLEGRVITKISVSQVDQTGQESEKRLFGYIIVDPEAPKFSEITVDGQSVTIDPRSGVASQTTVSKSKVIVTARVIDDVSMGTSPKVVAAVAFGDDPDKVAFGQWDFKTEVLASADGSFSAELPLAEGWNQVALAASDLAGNSMSKTLSVIYKGIPRWEISKPTITPAKPLVGQTITITTEVKNIGELKGSKKITLLVDREPFGDYVDKEETVEVTLKPGESKIVTFTYSITVSGSYWIQVDLQGTTVTATQ